MKIVTALLSMGIIGITGCATYDDDYAGSAPSERYYVVEQSASGQEPIRQHEIRNYRGTPDYQNNMEPRVRGKHADSLGWNTDNYYYQRGYR